MPKVFIALLCLFALAVPTGAQASRTQITSFEAPGDLLNDATREQTLNDISSFGVRAIRVILYWHNVAPAPDSRVRPNFDATDPAAYNWGQYDALIDAAAQRGWSVLLTVSGPVPRWATNGARNTVTRPSPALSPTSTTAPARRLANKTSSRCPLSG